MDDPSASKSAPGSIEREVKLAFPSVEAARSAILSARGIRRSHRRLQHDELFDTPEGRLRSTRSMLRLRAEDHRCLVTFKGPVQPSTVKVREEIETAVGDGAGLLTILQRAGFAVWFRYEKYREEFLLRSVVAAIDETPIGVFVELEGSEEGITATAETLGFGPHHFILDSYRGLFVRECEARGVPVTDMLFPMGSA